MPHFIQLFLHTVNKGNLCVCVCVCVCLCVHLGMHTYVCNVLPSCKISTHLLNWKYCFFTVNKSNSNDMSKVCRDDYYKLSSSLVADCLTYQKLCALENICIMSIHLSSYFTVPERFTYYNKIFLFLKRRFLIMKALDFCHILLPLVLNENTVREWTCTWGTYSSRICLMRLVSDVTELLSLKLLIFCSKWHLKIT